MVLFFTGYKTIINIVGFFKNLVKPKPKIRINSTIYTSVLTNIKKESDLADNNDLNTTNDINFNLDEINSVAPKILSNNYNRKETI